MDPEVVSDEIDAAPSVRKLCQYMSERSPQPMLAVEGPSHVVTYVNPAFARLVGRERRSLVGCPFAEVVPENEENECLALLNRVYRVGEAENLAEQRHGQVSPRPEYWSYAAWPIFGDDDRPAGVLLQVTDATDAALHRQQSIAMNEALMISVTRQHALTEAAQALNVRQLKEAVRARDHFLAVLSHELRNPLAALNAGIQLLRHELGDLDGTGESGSLLGMMGRQMKQLVRLVDDLLEVSRMTTGTLRHHVERVDLASVVRDAVEASRPLFEAGGHELTISLPPEPIALDADPFRLSQVFQNLLNNAAKYSDPGGQIRLSASREEDEVVVRVQDAGVGISGADLPHVFDVFVQVDGTRDRSKGGLGIGLSLVKEFVELHGGRVEAHSEGLGRGSIFVVRLPALAGPAAEPPSSACPSPASVEHRRRILVVDDNRDAAESLAMILELMGHDVRMAHDGAAALAASAEFRPDLVLMDLGMPIMDGYEAARRIRAEPWSAGSFLVALTGWGADDDRRRTREAGFDCHMVKPMVRDALSRLIAEMPTRMS